MAKLSRGYTDGLKRSLRAEDGISDAVNKQNNSDPCASGSNDDVADSVNDLNVVPHQDDIVGEDDNRDSDLGPIEGKSQSSQLNGKKGIRRVLTYGTFDTLHHGHIRLLRRARAQGDYLIVALSTDEFNALKGKTAQFSFDERKHDLEALRFVDLVIPETSWEQKVDDVRMYKIDVFVMGSDWAGHFDFLQDMCEVVYLERTPGISSSQIRKIIKS
jgi:glycerol-3-phosphate cytidylyltransferase